MSRFLAALGLLLLPACVPGQADTRGGFAAGEAADPDPTFEEDLADPTGPGDDDDDADDEDTTEDLTPVEWDSAPPQEVADGWILEATLVCGILDRAADKLWEKSGDAWYEQQTNSDARLLPGLEACAAQGPKVLRWDTDDSMYFEAAGMGHWLEPTATAGVWAGEAAPLGEVSPDCEAAIAEHGMSWPVPMQLTVHDVVSADEAPGA